MIVAPPFSRGSDHEMVAPRGVVSDPPTPTGSEGTVRGTVDTTVVLPTIADWFAVVIVTICTSYSVPLTSPVNVCVFVDTDVTSWVDDTGQDEPATRSRSSNRVNGPPPRSSGAIQSTIRVPLPALAAALRTANAAVAGVIAGDAADAGPTPIELMAATVTSYSVPFSSPPITHGDDEQPLLDTATPPPVGVATSR